MRRVCRHAQLHGLALVEERCASPWRSWWRRWCRHRPRGAATVQLENDGPGEHGTVDGYILGFQAAPGESNSVTITTGPGGILVRDTGAPLAAGAFCLPAVDGVTCAPGPGGALVPSAVVDLGDGDDRLTVLGLSIDVQDGPGDDVIEVPSGTFYAGTGADTMRITDSAAASEVTYATRTAGVSVTEDGVANDGEPGDHDDVGYGIQSVKGGSGDDVLVAGQEPHILDGNAGNDRLVGGPRDDILIGDDP
jgi:Ca2+-binding RTX toxin-like protein